VARELGDWVRAVFRQADSMHKNFYENLATREDVEDALREVEKLVKAVDEALAPVGDSERVAEAPGGKP
jgi:phosphate uptake regulator